MSKKCSGDKQVDLLLIAEGEKKEYAIIKDLITFMYDHTLHRRRKNFCRYCLQAFRTAGSLKYHIKDCFKINGKQRMKISAMDEYVKFKNYERESKTPFMFYADFESIVVPEDN